MSCVFGRDKDRFKKYIVDFGALNILKYNIKMCIQSWKLVGHVARIGERRGVYRVLVGKPEGKRPLGRSSISWTYVKHIIYQYYYLYSAQYNFLSPPPTSVTAPVGQGLLIHEVSRSHTTTHYSR
jgi:hypothetical protein